MSEVVLHYVGAGVGAHVPGLPACDLTAEMIEQSGMSVAGILTLNHGMLPLYVETDTVAEPPPTNDPLGGLIVIDTSDGVSDAEASAAGQVLAQRRQEKE